MQETTNAELIQYVDFNKNPDILFNGEIKEIKNLWPSSLKNQETWLRIKNSSLFPDEDQEPLPNDTGSWAFTTSTKLASIIWNQICLNIAQFWDCKIHISKKNATFFISSYEYEYQLDITQKYIEIIKILNIVLSNQGKNNDETKEEIRSIRIEYITHDKKETKHSIDFYDFNFLSENLKECFEKIHSHIKKEKSFFFNKKEFKELINEISEEIDSFDENIININKKHSKNDQEYSFINNANTLLEKITVLHEKKNHLQYESITIVDELDSIENEIKLNYNEIDQYHSVFIQKMNELFEKTNFFKKRIAELFLNEIQRIEDSYSMDDSYFYTPLSKLTELAKQRLKKTIENPNPYLHDGKLLEYIFEKANKANDLQAKIIIDRILKESKSKEINKKINNLQKEIDDFEIVKPSEIMLNEKLQKIEKMKIELNIINKYGKEDDHFQFLTFLINSRLFIEILEENKKKIKITDLDGNPINIRKKNKTHVFFNYDKDERKQQNDLKEKIISSYQKLLDSTLVNFEKKFNLADEVEKSNIFEKYLPLLNFSGRTEIFERSHGDFLIEIKKIYTDSETEKFIDRFYEKNSFKNNYKSQHLSEIENVINITSDFILNKEPDTLFSYSNFLEKIHDLIENNGNIKKLTKNEIDFFASLKEYDENVFKIFNSNEIENLKEVIQRYFELKETSLTEEVYFGNLAQLAIWKEKLYLMLAAYQLLKKRQKEKLDRSFLIKIGNNDSYINFLNFKIHDSRLVEKLGLLMPGIENQEIFDDEEKAQRKNDFLSIIAPRIFRAIMPSFDVSHSRQELLEIGDFSGENFSLHHPSEYAKLMYVYDNVVNLSTFNANSSHIRVKLCLKNSLSPNEQYICAIGSIISDEMRNTLKEHPLKTQEKEKIKDRLLTIFPYLTLESRVKVFNLFNKNEDFRKFIGDNSFFEKQKKILLLPLKEHLAENYNPNGSRLHVLYSQEANKKRSILETQYKTPLKPCCYAYARDNITDDIDQKLMLEEVISYFREKIHHKIPLDEFSLSMNEYYLLAWVFDVLLKRATEPGIEEKAKNDAVTIIKTAMKRGSEGMSEKLLNAIHDIALAMENRNRLQYLNQIIQDEKPSIKGLISRIQRKNGQRKPDFQKLIALFEKTEKQQKQMGSLKKINESALTALDEIPANDEPLANKYWLLQRLQDDLQDEKQMGLLERAYLDIVEKKEIRDLCDIFPDQAYLLKDIKEMLPAQEKQEMVIEFLEDEDSNLSAKGPKQS